MFFIFYLYRKTVFIKNVYFSNFFFVVSLVTLASLPELELNYMDTEG